jgi:hypothetical protein
MAERTCNACFENGNPTAAYSHPNWSHGSQCRDYSRQRTWTKKVRALLANTTPWEQRPVPQASEEWKPGALNGTAEIYTLLAQDGATYKRYRKAVDQLELCPGRLQKAA